jgi:beta-glucanase (GH16 family)
MPIGSIINTATLTPTFDDEFNSFSSSPTGSSAVWSTSMDYGNRTLGSNGEQEYYSDNSVGYNPFGIQNGVLDITAQPTSVAGANALSLPYDSGAITSQGSFSQLYGYFEINAELPAGQGLWPAFWLLPENGQWPPELDVFETLGNDPSTLYFSTHSGVQATQGTTLNVADTSQGFHTYGVMWGPQTVDLYIDNLEVASMPTPPDMNLPMYMVANLAVGGYWPGDPNSSTKFPATMQIDYIRAYAYPGMAGGTGSAAIINGQPGASQSGGAPANTGVAGAGDSTGSGPMITTPGTLQTANGVASGVAGVSIADNGPDGTYIVSVSDSNGLLQTSGTANVVASGEGSNALTLRGDLSAVNAALATLTYQGTGTDWVWVGATDPQGQQSSEPVIARVGGTATTGTDAGPVVTAPSGFAVTSGDPQAVSGVSIADNQAGGVFTASVSDSSGLLQTGATGTVMTTGENTTRLTLTGNLPAINAVLATLTYQGTAAGNDWVWVSTTDAVGQQGLASVIASVGTPQVGPSGATSSPTTDGAPVVSTPASLTVATGDTQPLSSVNMTDSQPTGPFTVIVSDSTGLVQTSAAADLAQQGEDTNALRLTGSQTAINANLASLTYQAGAATGTDWLWVSSNDTNGNQGISPVVVNVGDATTVDARANDAIMAASPATVESAASTSDDTTVNLTGVSIGLENAPKFLTATLTDSLGLLATTGGNDVTATGEGTTHLVLRGLLANVNAALATLTYTGNTGAAIASYVTPGSPPTDTLTLAVAPAGKYASPTSADCSTTVIPLFNGHLTA